MDKTTLSEIISDLKAKRDALSLAHEQLKVDNDNWNKCVIVLSLLTGGAGNDNYSHWLYDVLPRVALCENVSNLSKID